MYITFVSILFIFYIHCVLACSDSFPNLCASNQLKVGPYERFGPCNDGSGRDIPKDAAKNQPSIKFSSAQKVRILQCISSIIYHFVYHLYKHLIQRQLVEHCSFRFILCSLFSLKMRNKYVHTLT